MSTFLTDILAAITGSLKTLGGAIVEWIRVGFIQLFCEYTESQGVYTITGASPIAYFVFILMGIALAMSLTYFLVNLLLLILCVLISVTF